jgi:hypothetical protein
MLSTTANPIDGLRFDGGAHGVSDEPAHPKGHIAALSR